MSRRQPRLLQRERTGFAAKLHEALTDAGLTTENFARKVDVTLRTAQRWRNGETEPYASDLVVIARELDRDPAWFFEAADVLPAGSPSSSQGAAGGEAA